MKITIRKILSDNFYHKKWVNTLSYLEFVGARKIAKVLDSDTVTIEELGHFAEESRHSFYFKKLGHKFFEAFPENFHEENLLGGKEAKLYFQNLDLAISKYLRSTKTKLNYYLVTLLVEERALKVYSVYNQLLSELGFSFNLDALLKEESRHLEETYQYLQKLVPNFQKDKEPLSILEEDLFKVFEESINQEVYKDGNVYV